MNGGVSYSTMILSFQNVSKTFHSCFNNSLNTPLTIESVLSISGEAECPENRLTEKREDGITFYCIR